MKRNPYQELVPILDRMQAAGELEYIQNAPLAPYSSFRIGGPADFAVWPHTRSALLDVLSALRELEIRRDLFGNGSNVLFADEGYRGVVIFTTKMNRILYRDGILWADAGVSFTGLAVRALQEGLTGLEFAYGIPGSVGGAIYMNAGAYDGEISQVCVETTVYDPNHALLGGIGEVTGAAQGFGYRTSVFQSAPEAVILGGKFRLKSGNPAEIKAKMDDLMARRREKQPLEYPSAGSTFKRAPGYFTAKLIHEAGLKGAMVGGAQVSEKHAGFVINKDGATARDVLTLIEQIKEQVVRQFGVEIECEVRIIPAE
ncbi:MAG: UDP-N-acetylmuramate dehydrogenase [Clostridia bacterium]|nr:UDP-N-acetylmuramate dehydrogenase [Clostridia bacterium]